MVSGSFRFNCTAMAMRSDNVVYSYVPPVLARLGSIHLLEEADLAYHTQASCRLPTSEKPPHRDANYFDKPPACLQ